MMLKLKICGVSDSKTLNYIINHDYPPQFIGFIVNYPKSKRYVNKEKLQEILKVDKKNSFFVAVLVDPEKKILEEIKNFPFDYYQLYDCSYEKSMPFDHSYIRNIDFDKEVMLAGNIQIYDDLEKYKKIADIIDISGGLESSGFKDASKIEIFLKKLKNVNDET